VYNHCKICNILTYFCSIRTKRLQHVFSAQYVTLLLGRMEFVVVELNASAEVGGGAWSSQVRQRSGEH
jgi:hypothetical protein